MDKKIVFICAPFAGDVIGNTEKTKRYCRFAMEQGTVPFSSALLYPQFLDDADPDERALGLSFSTALLCICDEVWAFGDVISSGMELELKAARSRNIPVTNFTTDCEVRL